MFSNEMNLRNPRATDRGTQLNAAHAQLLQKLRPIAVVETYQFLTIQSLEFQVIWPKTRTQVNDLSRKIWILTEGIFNTTENDLQEITKIASVEILLKQCLQKGFHVNS